MQSCIYIFLKIFLCLILPNSGCPCGSAGKESACNVRDLGLIPGLGRSPGEENGYPLQYSGLENSMDSIVYVVTELDMTEQVTLSSREKMLKIDKYK